jgi:hypothetical protein
MADPAPKKGKKKWLVALMAAALAAVEVAAPHASPLAELLVRVVSPLVLRAAPHEVAEAERFEL